MRKLPPLNALRAFEAAARLGSFKLAAEELHVTPTAISHQIRHLEEQLGYALFQRHPKPMRLTEPGSKLFPDLRDSLDRIASSVASLEAAGKSGTLVVATTRAFASRWLIAEMESMQRAGLPGLAIEASESIVDLHRGDADFAIRYARTPPSGVESMLLFSDQYIVTCSPSLVSDACALEDLVDFPLIHFDWKRPDPDAPTWPRWVAEARTAHPHIAFPDPESGIRFSEEIHAIEAAIRGQGLALLSDRLVSKELEHGTLCRPVQFEIQGLKFFGLYRRDHPRKHDIERILTFFRSS